MNTRGLAHGRAVIAPGNRRSLCRRGLEQTAFARPYLGIAMQPVEVPNNLRSKLPAGIQIGLLVTHVENGAPAEKAGVLLGDVLFEMRSLRHLCCL